MADISPPVNDYVLVEPIISDEKSQVILPDSAQYLQDAKVLDVGSDFCVPLFFDKGMGPLVKKSEIAPNVKEGAIVSFRKVALERRTMDAAYSRRLPDGRNVVYVKIMDIICAQ